MCKKKKSLMQKFTLILVTLSLFGIGTEICAQQQISEPAKGSELLELSFEELMEVSVVVSASRQAQKHSDLSVPVSVITADDIHYSGQTTIPDILQFTPGIDILQYDRNTYATGVRGLHGRYSNRILSLLDGRVADSPIWGGPEFYRLPLFLEDIERIEVVRGPGGAVWGANAFTGIINIITKDPNDCLGWFVSTTLDTFGDSYTHMRWGQKKDKWRWRSSFGYEDRETSEDSISNDHFRSHDFSRRWRYDIKAIYEPLKTTKWTMGAGYSHIEAGNFDSGGGSYSRELRRFETGRAYTKVDKVFSETSTGHLQ
ncbi:MAG: TonB-dependent receptor [Planctomycetes bacterium]|nr:TonB-dependent receptor [Planctomycetota bacterium]